jgi:valyl-tRNA synthetase
MKPNLPKIYQPENVESRIYTLWQKSGFFNPDRLPGKRKKTFTIVIPPPNITGELHMGHALQDVIHDILIRKKRMEGFKTLWLPGTDHAGIATQNVVEKQLKKEGKTRFDLGREKFIERIWQWKEKYGNIILDQLKKLGCSLDWSRTRFTMDKDYVKAVNTAFLHYYKKGWIYQGERVVNWCPRCRTSLSDLELEYKEKEGSLWYIRYPLKNKGFIVVATTRPETMLGDTAVAVNPKDKRYKKLVGQKVILPLVNREIPIIADKAVDPKFGTGAVKVTPAHDFTDWEIGLRHKLDTVLIINERGEMTKESKICQGLSPFSCREKVVKELKKKNLIEKVEDYTHSVPYCYRCNSLIEPIPSKQWFLKMDTLAKMAIKAVKSRRVKFSPKRWERIYFNWLKNIQDWCISRQLWWGHQLPVYAKQEEIRNPKSEIRNNLEIRNSKLEIYVGDTPPKNYIQVPDVLDTWFSSALWPFATLGWPKKTKDLKTFYPTDVLVTDRGIINLWVARMIFSGLEFMKKEPFHTALIHATVLTREGKRMSKSLGTGIDPIELVRKYGADATRFGIAYQIMGGQDIRFVEDNILMGKKFCNKIWNASRFVLLQIGNSKFEIRNSKLKNLAAADKKILNQLNKTIKSVDKDIESFKFGKAAHTLYDFFWHDFCDVYIEYAKDKNDKQTKNILLYVLLTSLKLLHPFIPFVTEEIYQKIPIKNKKKFLMVEAWPACAGRPK